MYVHDNACTLLCTCKIKPIHSYVYIAAYCKNSPSDSLECYNTNIKTYNYVHTHMIHIIM